MGTRKLAKANPDNEATLRRRLKAEPRHHWLLTRLSSVYYERRRYALALKYAEKAFEEAPALDLYARIVTRGVNQIATNECGEGKAWARGLVTDSHYRASLSLKAIGNEKASLSAFDECLSLRGPGCRSIYRLAELGAADTLATRPNRR
jgi:tetratricopeptide (TPR) repeat protein